MNPPLHCPDDPGLPGWHDAGPIAHGGSRAERVRQNTDELGDLPELNRSGGNAPAIAPVAELNPALPRVPRDSQRCAPTTGVRNIEAGGTHRAIMALLSCYVESRLESMLAARQQSPGHRV